MVIQSILLVVVFLAIVGGAVVFFQYRRIVREEKNYERALKMVPLLIHLPPASDDIESNGRDVRDVVEENISKAQIIYNIIASTAEKGFKTKIYGQRHISFEIVGWHGFVYFYVAVPVGLVEVVQQAIVSAYPASRVEEVSEHNIFNRVGKITGTIGGQLKLKEHFAYPIATYQDLKRDALQSILNALSTLEKEDGAGIQILIRPADSSWRKAASAVASNRRKGGSGKNKPSKAMGYMSQLATAFVKAPSSAEDSKKSGGKDLSNLDQSILDSIDDKTRYPGFEVLIRAIVSSNVSYRAQSILNNVVASFSLFDAPGKNGFKFVPAKNINSFVTSYIMRFFPQSVKSSVLNSIELSTLFHFPDQSNIPTSQLERQGSKQVDGPRNVPEEGLLLGYNVFRAVKKPIRISLNDRQRHMYVVGQTGTGKSTFLENLALQDMLNGDGFAFVDPHGDTIERILAMVPKERTEDIIYFSPADMEYPIGLNLFEFNSPDQKDFLIQEAINMLYKLYDPQRQGIIGPRYEHLFRNASLTVMADPAGGTFIEIPKLFRDPKFVQQKLRHVTDPTVVEFWQKEMPASQRSNEFGDVVSWFISKFGAFLSNQMMRDIIGQPKSGFDLRKVMDEKKILLVNLSKGRCGELNSKLLGMIFVMKFQAAAMSRSNIPEDQRVDFALYVDEFQNFSTDSFATIMSEARKYHLNLIVANQFTTQLTDEIRDAVFGNMGTIVSFRVGQNDVEALRQYFQPIFTGDDLLRIPNYNAIIRTLVGGVPTQPFSMATLPPLGTPNFKLSEALKQLSAAKYGRPRSVVESEINGRLETKAEFNSPLSRSPFAGSSATPNWGGSGTASGSFPPANPQQGPRPSSSSFLDEWLAKRRSGMVQSATATPPSTTDQIAPNPNHQYLNPITQGQPLSTQSLSHSPDNTASSMPNISSNELQKKEVESIARTLNQSTEGKIDLNPPIPQEDTIRIDQAGNLTQVNSAEKIDNQTPKTS